MELTNKILSDITVHMKYAKYISDLERRETWDELVSRNKKMHLKKYPELSEEQQKYKLSDAFLDRFGIDFSTFSIIFSTSIFTQIFH